MAKKYSVQLSDETVLLLKSYLKKKDTSETVCNRCRILLDMDENHPPVLTQVNRAKAHGICRATVSNTVKRYCTKPELFTTQRKNTNECHSHRLREKT